MENQDDQRIHPEATDTEFSQEVASGPNDPSYTSVEDERADQGYGWGIAGIVLAVLSFFLWPYLLAPIGIILGVVGVSQGSKLGWWAIGLGVIALILVTIFMIFAIPFRILF